jgi:nifR3 family TIM-barrel protein
VKVKNINIEGHIALAPLAGYTNIAYRTIMKEFGADLVYSEMISAKGLLYESEKTWELAAIHKDEHPIAIQIFGGDIDAMVAAAKLIDTKTEADIIDINMGCPVKKVLRAEGGCHLLGDVKKVECLVSEIVKNVKKPVSVKMRAGLTHQTINGVENAKAMERAGASLIAIHGRTQSDMYTGKVRLDYIKAIKEAVSIPVIGNGDIRSIHDAQSMLDETKVDMIMVGRASLGNPWFIRDLSRYFRKEPMLLPPSDEEKINMCKQHLKKLMAIKSERQAILEMRSLAAWYVKGITHSKDFRRQLNEITREEELSLLLDNLLYRT